MALDWTQITNEFITNWFLYGQAKNKWGQTRLI